MADDKTKRGRPDRRKVAAGEGYEVDYFARKHGLTNDQAREVIARVGTNRDELNREAKKVRQQLAERNQKR